MDLGRAMEISKASALPKKLSLVHPLVLVTQVCCPVRPCLSLTTAPARFRFVDDDKKAPSSDLDLKSNAFRNFNLSET